MGRTRLADEEQVQERDARSAQTVVFAASCLGRLGRWGNQIFQWSALRLAAELHGGKLLCPDWAGRRCLVEAASDALLTADVDASLPLCADRPVLSHAGFRAWALTREPLKSASLLAGDVSGHQLRRFVPQVNAAILLQPSTTTGYPGPRAAAYWGWFAFHTSAFAPHRCRFAQLMALSPALGAAVHAHEYLLRASGDVQRPMWGIHMRCGEGFTPLGADGREKSTAPAEAWTPPEQTGMDAQTSSTTGIWRDTGVFWSAPAEWYATWLQNFVAVPNAPAPIVLLFSDDPDAARRALGPQGASVTWVNTTALAESFGGGDDGGALADWFLMARCETLVISNSTYSFAAAMLATAVDGQRCTCFRPDPSARGIVKFDPWNASPTLKLLPD
jgi:hypothetical protein